MEFEFVTEWFKYADMDLKTSEHLLSMRPKPLEIICYHCQQSAEKYLKGFLISSGITEPPKIHNLDTLCLMCMEYDPRFREIKKACSVLTQYGTQPRYPNEIEVLENDVQNALEYTRQIRDIEPLAEVRLRMSKNDNDEMA